MMKRNLVWAGKGVGEHNYDYGFAVSFFFFFPEKQPPPTPAQNTVQIILKHTFCKSFNFKQLIY